MYSTYQYMIDNQIPLAYEADYPYKGRDDNTCHNELFGETTELLTSYPLVVDENDFATP